VVYLFAWQEAGVPDGVIETRTARIWMGEDGILRGAFTDGADEKEEDAVANVATGAKIAGDRKIPVLVDLRSASFISQEARMVYAGREANRLALAAAIIVGSPLSRLIGNFFVGLNKPAFPTRLFTSEREAIAWLKGHMQ
jgi:hypothetical protein